MTSRPEISLSSTVKFKKGKERTDFNPTAPAISLQAAGRRLLKAQRSSRRRPLPCLFHGSKAAPGVDPKQSTWAPKVRKIMAFMAIIMALGLLFYILLGSR